MDFCWLNYHFHGGPMFTNIHITYTGGHHPTGFLVGVLVDSLINPLKAQNTTNPSWLVVLTILKNMEVSWDYYFQYMEKKMFETTVMALYQL